MLNIELIDRLFYELMYAVETAKTVGVGFSPRPLMDTRLLGYDEDGWGYGWGWLRSKTVY